MLTRILDIAVVRNNGWTHYCLVMLYCIRNLHNGLRQWLVACLVPSHYLNQRRIYCPLNPRKNKLQLNFDQITNIFAPRKYLQNASHFIQAPMCHSILMAWCKTAVSAMLTHWRCCGPALSHQSMNYFSRMLCFKSDFTTCSHDMPPS